jgi:hypothetical protein
LAGIDAEVVECVIGAAPPVATVTVC